MTLSRITLLRLHQVPGIGQRTLYKILAWADSSDERLGILFELNPDEISRLFHLKADLATALKHSSIERAEALAEELYRNGWQLITQSDPGYPPQLRKQIADKAPPMIYVRGSIDHLAKPGLAFSGSRHSSEQGLNHTATLVRQAVKQGLSVISGHAPGVDSIAHQTTLEQDGVTILVLPEGVLTFKLRSELRSLYERSPQNVVVVSEFPPHMPWSAQSAMLRNQIIIGLAQALCVIESGDTGGTLSAGQTALKLNIPVFVLRYPEPPPSAAGNHLLLEQGAQPIPVHPEVVLPDLSGGTTQSGSENTPKQLSLF